MPFLRRCALLGLLLFGGVGQGHAQVIFTAIPVPRHAAFSAMPPRNNPAMTTSVLKALTDAKEDALPSSTAAAYYGITVGNTRGPVTNATKADWLSKTMNWITGTPATPTSSGSPSLTQRGVAAIENTLTWIEELVAPELTIRTEQMADFQRALKCYQLLRQVEIMAKSWHGSIFSIDLLDILPVFETVTLDDFGIPSGGLLSGVRYKDKVGMGSTLSSFGLDDPFVGSATKPLLRYKGPRKLSDISFQVEASPYDGTETDSHALRIGKAGNELLDRVFFEGVMGRNMAGRGAYYTPRVGEDRPSPVLLRQRAENARDIRMAQILEEADAYAKAYKMDPMLVLDQYKDELKWWQMKPQALYDNQMHRLNRFRNELQPVHNDITKLESADKLKEESDPSRKTFLENLFNLYTQLGDDVNSIKNAVTGEENEGDNPGPRLLYKANVSYAKATHAAYLEALAIRRYLAAKIQAESQRGSAEGFYNLFKTVQERQSVLARQEVRTQLYKENGARILNLLDRLGITTDEVIAEARK